MFTGLCGPPDPPGPPGPWTVSGSGSQNPKYDAKQELVLV